MGALNDVSGSLGPMRKRETGSVARSVEKSSTYDPSTTPTRVAATEPEESMLKTAEPIEFADDEHAATNLELFADNTSELYGRKKDILRLLAVQDLLGTYDTAKAQKLWRGWIDVAALMYEKELGEKGDARRVFTPAIRDAVAASVEKSEKAELDLGNHDYLLDKKASTKQAADGNEALEQKEAELRFKRKDIGTLMLNWHGGSGDPIYAVGSYWIDGKQHPQPEVLERAKNGIGKLIGQASTEAGRKANGWTDADLDELYTIRDGMDEIEAEENALKAKEATTKDAVAKQAALSRQEAYALMASPLQDKALLIVGTNAAGNEDWDYVGYDLKAGDVPVDFLVSYMHRMGGMPDLKKEDLTPHSFVESQTKTLTKVVVSYALGDNRSIDVELRLKKAKEAAGGLGLSESAIATHLDVMQDMLAKGDTQGLKKRLDQLAADIKRIAQTRQAVRSATDTVSTDGYHYVLEAGGDIDDPEAWETEMGEATGQYRGDVMIDGSRCILFHNDETGDDYAVLPQNATINGKEASIVVAGPDLRSLAIDLYKSVVGKAGKEVAQMIQEAIKKAYELGAAEKAARVASLLKTAAPDADDLVLYIDNTESLYKRKQEIVKATMRHLRSGKYDAAKSAKLWLYLVDAGAQAWAKELGDEEGNRSVKWNDLFPKAVREQAARDMSETAKVEIQDGTWDFLNEKGAKTAAEGPKKFDPRSAVVYFDIHFDEDNLKEDAGDPSSPAHEEAKKILSEAQSSSGSSIHKLEGQAMAQAAKILGHSFSNEGHDRFDDLVCKITSVHSVEDVSKLFDTVSRKVIGGDDIIDLAPYFVAQNFVLFPEGVNGPQVPFADFDDWKEEVKSAAVKEAAGAGLPDPSELGAGRLVDLVRSIQVVALGASKSQDPIGTIRKLLSSAGLGTVVEASETKSAGPRDPKKPKGDFALVRGIGMDDVVVSVHPTKESAEEAMRKKGGEPGSLFTKGMRIVDVGPSSRTELVNIFGKWTIRPKTASAPRVAASWKALDDKLGKRWILDAKDSDVFEAFHIKEIKGPGIPLYSTQVIMKDGTTLRYRALKDLKEAQKVAESYLKSDKENASLLLTDGWTRT